MADPVSIDDLRPYKAVLIARVEDDNGISAVQAMNKLKKVLKVKVRDKGRRVAASGARESSEPTYKLTFVHYEDRRPVAWSRTPILDKVNHLALILVSGNWLAIHLTETSRRQTVEKALRAGKLGKLMLVPPARLKAAFIKGRARTLWLKALHRSTPHKADTKVLGSRDLVPALDPLDDQSYRYTATRCEPDNEDIGEVMGLAVDQSRLWVGPSEDLADFQRTILAILDALEATTEFAEEPLPVLAVANTGLTGVEDAYDMAITPPELLAVGPVLDASQAESLAAMERLAFSTQFELTDSNGSMLEAMVLRGGSTLGKVELIFQEVGNEIKTIVDGQANPGHVEEFAEVLDFVRDPAALTVYFDSGHAVQDRQAFAPRHRDLPFTQWAWVSFDDWEPHREKPGSGLGAIGNSDRSLFSWVLEHWPGGAGLSGAPGWLACDDRPGETADFLHIDDSDGTPVLTLIHVKSASSDSAGRGIAVVPYETVSAQAVKNLRHLDATLARGELLSGTVPKALPMLAWEGGQQRTRAEFIDQLDQLGANVARRVVIVQPHVRKDLVDEVRADSQHSQLPRLRQLDTILNGVAANCRSSGAELIVVGSA